LRISSQNCFQLGKSQKQDREKELLWLLWLTLHPDFIEEDEDEEKKDWTNNLLIQNIASSLIADTTPMITLILDEIDQLTTKERLVLYNLFELIELPHSKLIIIGISNCSDFVERHLPQLRGRESSPKLVEFAPYSADQITTMLTERLCPNIQFDEKENRDQKTKKKEQINHYPMPFDRYAIEFCSKKVGSSSGDFRKALDICIQALDIAESRALDHFKQTNTFQMMNVQIEDIKNIVRIVSPIIEQLRKLPFHQQLLISSLLHSSSVQSCYLLQELHKLYFEVCKQKGIESVEKYQIGELIHGLLAAGLFISESDVFNNSMSSPTSSRSPHKHQLFKLNVEIEDIQYAFEGIPLLSPPST